jgi:hypothetical protein
LFVFCNTIVGGTFSFLIDKAIRFAILLFILFDIIKIISTVTEGNYPVKKYSDFRGLFSLRHRGFSPLPLSFLYGSLRSCPVLWGTEMDLGRENVACVLPPLLQMLHVSARNLMFWDRHLMSETKNISVADIE